MRRKIIWLTGLILALGLVNAQADDVPPSPESWSFPQVVESARKISPVNVEGRPFNRFGIVYSLDELEKLELSTMEADELQKYADIVTHAYPDAVAEKLPETCDDLDVENLNETAIAGIAFVSINAINDDTRKRATICLSTLQAKLSQNGK